MKEFTYQDYLIYEKIRKNKIEKLLSILKWKLLNMECKKNRYK